jgi:hypothetical protein
MFSVGAVTGMALTAGATGTATVGGCSVIAFTSNPICTITSMHKMLRAVAVARPWFALRMEDEEEAMAFTAGNSYGMVLVP